MGPTYLFMISPSLIVSAASGLREAAAVKTSPNSANSNSSKMTNFSIAAIMNSATSNGGQKRRPSSEEVKAFRHNGKLRFKFSANFEGTKYQFW